MSTELVLVLISPLLLLILVVGVVSVVVLRRAARKDLPQILETIFMMFSSVADHLPEVGGAGGSIGDHDALNHVADEVDASNGGDQQDGAMGP